MLAGPTRETALVAHLEAMLRAEDIKRKREGIRYMQSRSWLASAMGSFDESLVADDLLLDMVDGGFFDPEAAGDLLADGVLDGATDSARKGQSSDSEDEELEAMLRLARNSSAAASFSSDEDSLGVERENYFVDGGFTYSSDEDSQEGEGELFTTFYPGRDPSPPGGVSSTAPDPRRDTGAEPDD